jgi:hypothetical protein
MEAVTANNIGRFMAHGFIPRARAQPSGIGCLALGSTEKYEAQTKHRRSPVAICGCGSRKPARENCAGGATQRNFNADGGA